MTHRSDADRLRDHALMGRMRLGDVEALREFFARYEPLLREIANEQRSGRAQAQALVLEVLDDVAQRVWSHRLGPVASLAGYVANALRNRMVDRQRQERRRERLERAVATALDGEGQSAILSACSAHSLRMVRSADAEDDEPDPIFDAMYRHIEGLLSVEELRLLGWVGERVPQRDIAAWLGTTHGAVRVRVFRLRARVTAAAKHYVTRLAPHEREHLERLYTMKTPFALISDARGRGGADD